MERARLMLHKHRSHLLKYENVLGVGLGYKTIANRTTVKPSVVVLVDKKMPLGMMKKGQILPRTLGEDVPTDVLEIGKIKLLSYRTEHMRPARPGISIGHYKITAGTFGALVYDKKTGEPLILSNNHVIANVTDGRDGRAKIGDAIYQPGPYDGGTEADIIAKLERFVPVYRDQQPSQCPVANLVEAILNAIIRTFKPHYTVKLFRSGNEENVADAAVAKPISKDIVKSDIIELGEIKGTSTGYPGLSVVKSGRSSGVTRGQIKVVDATMKVMMDEGEYAVFNKQFVTDPLAKPGDSGSVVLDNSNHAVGLLFAGSDRASIVTPIETVMEKLGIRF
jgi:hypothetical protein